MGCFANDDVKSEYVFHLEILEFQSDKYRLLHSVMDGIFQQLSLLFHRHQTWEICKEENEYGCDPKHNSLAYGHHVASLLVICIRNM
jgi:hypothetical protein